MTEPSTEDRAEALARAAADRAAKLALVDADKATTLAVARAVKDANIDRDLAEHSAHLREINHSQEKMAHELENVNRTLTGLATTFEKQTLIQETLSSTLAKQRKGALSRTQVWIAAFGVIAAYATIVVLLINASH